VSITVELFVAFLSGVVGWFVIGQVPNTLHTPLMSATNAIHGIVVLGAVILAFTADSLLSKVLLVVAIAFGTLNVVGGFLVTDRMLSMFRRPTNQAEDGEERR
jgi:proton-translocating NAD(P)+ transhydrogenase subunit alpha